jgi:hypothetical protein
MLKRTRMLWLVGPIAWAIVALVFEPAAEAQISGLFPLAPVHKRQRTPRDMEDPAYRMYRQDYFGYHPTCWRKFPAGWGCPSSEAPDAKESFRQRKLDLPPAGDAGEGEGAPGPDEGMRPGGARPDPNALPNLPSGGSPFEIEKPPAGRDRDRGTVPDPSGLPPTTDPRAPERPTPPGASIEAPPPAPTPPGAGESELSVAPPPGLILPDPTAGAGAAVAVPEPTAYNGSQPARRRGFLSQLFSGQAFRR